jgi:hypothetical protein
MFAAQSKQCFAVDGICRQVSQLVIGGYADSGVLSNRGSSQVQGEGGPLSHSPAVARTRFLVEVENYQRSNPLRARCKYARHEASFTYH